jgi:hypothetical protein
VKIADLTPEQQMDVIVSEFQTAQDKYKTQIKELNERKPELKFEDPQAQTLVDYLKNGGDIKRLAKEILSKDPAAQATMLSDAEVVKADIKKNYPTYSDADLEEEFKEMSEAQVARRAKAARANLVNSKPDYSALTVEQKAQQEKLNTDAITAFETEKKNVVDKATALEEIAGVKVSKPIRDYLLSQVLPENKDGESKFVEALAGSPEKLLRLSFLDTYHEKLMKQAADHYYKKGLAEGNKGKEKLSDEPVRTYSSSGKGKATEKTAEQLEKEFFETVVF